jgi:hypothetical protein
VAAVDLNFEAVSHVTGSFHQYAEFGSFARMNEVRPVIFEWRAIVDEQFDQKATWRAVGMDFGWYGG